MMCDQLGRPMHIDCLESYEISSPRLSPLSPSHRSLRKSLHLSTVAPSLIYTMTMVYRFQYIGVAMVSPITIDHKTGRWRDECRLLPLPRSSSEMNRWARWPVTCCGYRTDA
jgi:hypothetical protein